MPDASRAEVRPLDAAVAIQAASTDAAVRGNKATREEPDASAEDDAGEPSVAVDKTLGSTGLRVGDILGYYSGEWGQMVLRAYGDEIWGVYEYRDGTITGRVNDEGVFMGWWTQLPTRTGTDAGEVEFRWSKIANTTIALDGRWRYGTDGDWLENWDIVRVTDRSAPSYLTDRFAAASDFMQHP